MSADRLITDVRIVDYGIRGMHLAYDLLDGYSVLVLVDAVPGDGSPGDISVLEVRESDLDGDLSSGEIDAHGMEPVSVLASLGKLGGTLPRTYVVDCRPASLEEDIGLSEPVAAAVPTAVIPGRVVDVVGMERRINIGMLEDQQLSPGDWILIHMGFAMERIDEVAGKAALAGLQMMGSGSDPQPEPRSCLVHDIASGPSRRRYPDRCCSRATRSRRTHTAGRLR